jgi:hypothetical protein
VPIGVCRSQGRRVTDSIPKVRNPHTGSLKGLARESIHHKMIDLRDSLTTIKRYLYRRICSGAFEPIKDRDISKGDLRRMSVWLQPTRCTKPTKTEVICFNSNLGIHTKGIGSPAVLFPPDNSRTNKDFFSSSYELLKKRIFLERKFPVALLGLLSAKAVNSIRVSVSLPDS